jgi:hypothetical protein
MTFRTAALATFILCLPLVGGAQQHQWAPPHFTLTIDGLDARTRVIAPRNALELARNGTLRELELEIEAGPVSDALARTHQTRTRIGSLTIGPGEGTSAYHKVTLKNALVTGYTYGATSATGDGYARVRVQFHWEPASAAAGKSEPIDLLEVVATSGPSEAQSGDGFADLIAGTQPARLASPGALQSLRVEAAQNQPIAIEVQRGSALERLLRSSLTGKKVIPKLTLALSEPGTEGRGTQVMATLSNVRVAASKRSNTVGMEVISLSYENVTFD